MGFRDLHAVSLALLGKQGWHFLTNHTSLDTRVFKAKYFPNCDFLGASVGHNPSFVWRSVWSSQKLLKDGVRWIIENGSNISVWHDEWLRDGRGLLYNAHQQDLEGLNVKDVLHPQLNEWNLAIINMIFDPGEASGILMCHCTMTLRGTRECRAMIREVHTRFGPVTDTIWTTVLTLST